MKWRRNRGRAEAVLQSYPEPTYCDPCAEMFMMVGEGTGARWDAKLSPLRWGRIFVFKTPKPYEGERWGFDNGAFTDWRQGRAFDGDAYRRRLDAAVGTGEAPYLAVLPDVVAGGMASLEFSLSWLGRIPYDWPWYLATQDGMTREDVAAVLDQHAGRGIYGLFVGGSDKFKATAPLWADLACEYGIRCHYGRASTPARMEFARDAGCHSCDSAFPMWTRERFALMADRWENGNPQIAFEF